MTKKHGPKQPSLRTKVVSTKTDPATLAAVMAHATEHAISRSTAVHLILREWAAKRDRCD